MIVVLGGLRLLALTQNPVGEKLAEWFSNEDYLEIEVERPGKIVFYDTLKETNPDGEALMPLEAPLEKAVPSQKTPERQVRVSEKVIPPKKVVASEKIFAVQVAAFKEEPPAREMKTHLIREGYPVYVDPERIPGKGLWHRVRIGPYSDRGEAERVASQVTRDEKLNAFVTIERKSRN